MKSVNLGGQRLGTGNKMNVNLHGYDRSTFNLNKVFRSSMAPGTLVPCYVNIGEPGDTFDIDIKEMVRTLPTNGPLMGSFKMQIDFFTAPIRLYNGLLHNNAIGVGLDMDKIKFPQLKINQFLNEWNNNQKQISPSSLMAYCGLRGLFKQNKVKVNKVEEANSGSRQINALPFLAYYDIFKNYYSNKQEENCYIIQTDQEKINGIDEVIVANYTSRGQVHPVQTVSNIGMINKINSIDNAKLIGNGPAKITENESKSCAIFIVCNQVNGNTIWNDLENAKIIVEHNGSEYYVPLTNDTKKLGPEDNKMWLDALLLNYERVLDFIPETNLPAEKYKDKMFLSFFSGYLGFPQNDEITKVGEGDNNILGVFYENKNIYRNTTSLKAFPLQNFDDIREYILKHSEKGLPPELPLTLEPFKTLLSVTNAGNTYNQFAQNGLMVKTYLSDIFNNWLNTETMDGENGINAISRVSTEGNHFTIDALNLAQKVYNLLNRIAVSGGTYNDWQEAVFDVETTGQAETPIYYGGLSAEIAFEEVVSTADTTGTQAGEQPLGSLAGKGSSRQRNDGHVIIKVNEPSIIMGIVSITPRLDYSQGNKWFLTELQSMNDLHKPALDGIGFQDLMLERMVGSSVELENIPGTKQWFPKTEQKAVGKQPAWIEYQTDINECYGDFAEENKAMYMTLNRRYNIDKNGNVTDITTYIDPSKFNYAFADTAIEAQNFWVQIAMDIEARRKMSAKMIPNI